MKKERVGSGLTESTILTYSFDEWIQKAREDKNFLRDALQTYPECLLSWRDWATRVLAKQPAKSDDLNAEEETIEWYASQILRLVNDELALVQPCRVRTHSEMRPRTEEERLLADLASRATACRLGSLVERVRWKFRYERAAQREIARMKSWPAIQAQSVPARRELGAQNRKRIERLLDDTIKKSPKSLINLPISQVVHEIERVNPTSAREFPKTTLRRHLENILTSRRTIGRQP
jgi:hypothetical protein